MHDSDDSDLADDYSDEEDARATERRDEAIAELKALKSEPTQADIDKFWDDYADVVALKPDNTTFFHEIIQEVGKRQKQNVVDAGFIRPLFMALVKKLPKLLEETDNNGETPLYSAINHRRPKTWRLVKYILQCCDDDSVKNHVINAMKHLGGRGGQACLNLAFEHDVSDSVLRSLVTIANAEVLELVDSSKKTPFLHAVQYEQCDKNRVELIGLLLEKDMEIVERHRTRDNRKPRITTFLDLKYSISKSGSVEYSVYGEHERSKRIHLENIKSGKDQAPTTRAVRNELLNPKAKDSNTDHKVNEAPKSMPTHPKKFKDQTTGDHDTGSRGNLQDRDQLKIAVTAATDEKQRFRQEKRREHRQDKVTDQDPPGSEILRGHQEISDEATGNQSGAQASSDNNSKRTPNTSLKRTNTSNPTSQVKTTEKKSSPSTKAKAEPGILAENSEKIREMLKLHYIRTRDVDLATSFLYGKNVQDVHICFEYVGPRTIKDQEFITRFGKDSSSGLKFDEVLSYVKFPPVTVERTGNLKSNEEHTSRSKTKLPGLQDRGRRDMEFFFNWLYDKGVRRIVEVDVNDRVGADHGEHDCNDMPHSDEAIQRSLQKIVVEHLNWKKTDLDPQAICQVSSRTGSQSLSSIENDCAPRISNNLREVTLQWSGNNTALRAWSEPEGLPRLPNLEVVNLDLLSSSHVYDSGSYIRKRIEEFEDRLNTYAANRKTTSNSAENPESVTSQGSTTSSKQGNSRGGPNLPKRRKIAVNPPEDRKEVKRQAASGDRRESPEEGLTDDEHEWITSVGEVSSIMWGLWTSTLRGCQERLKASQANSSAAVNGAQLLQSLGKPVTVALIDDGVYSFDPAFSNRVIEGKTFDYHDGWIGQHYDSARGHGTEMAKLICKVCPMAEIYSIRLKTETSLDGQCTIDATSAGLAIDAALEKNASIISMSWTIPKPVEANEKRFLDAILRKACNRNVLLFCSPPDSVTKNQEGQYPWAYEPESIFLIGAAHSDGTPYNRAGQQVNFIFPGVNVNIGNGANQRKRPIKSTALNKEATGSSIATALAAGLAALIMCCFKTSAIHLIAESLQQDQSFNPSSARVRPEDVERMSQHNTMKAAFERIGSTGKNKFVQVWKMIRSDGEFFNEDSTEEEKMRCVIEFCASIFSGHS